MYHDKPLSDKHEMWSKGREPHEKGKNLVFSILFVHCLHHFLNMLLWMISIGKHLDKFLVSTFLIKLCQASVLKDLPNLVQNFLVQKSLEAGNDDVSTMVSTNMVATDRSMKCC
jgi:hypothetical protein